VERADGMRGLRCASKASLPDVYAGIVNGIDQTPRREKEAGCFPVVECVANC